MDKLKSQMIRTLGWGNFFIIFLKSLISRKDYMYSTVATCTVCSYSFHACFKIYSLPFVIKKAPFQDLMLFSFVALFTVGMIFSNHYKLKSQYPTGPDYS